MSPSLARILASPATLLISGTVFAVTVWMLPISRPSPSTAGSLIAELMGQARSTTCVFPSFEMGFVRQGNGFKPLNIEELQEAWQAGTSPMPNNVLLYVSGRTAGLWSPTRRTHAYTVQMDDTGLTSAEITTIRNLFIDHLAAIDPAMATEIPALRTGNVLHLTVLWRGWLHNLASLASFSLFAASSLVIVRRKWRSFRTPPGFCPHCRYDLRATPPGSPCPECGRPIG